MTKSDEVALNQEFELTVNKTVKVDSLSITLTQIQLPKTNVPGNREFYHLQIESKGHSHALLLDPFNQETPFQAWRLIRISGTATNASITLKVVRNDKSGITKDTALKNLQTTLAKETPHRAWTILAHITIEKEFGWVFFYVPEKYAQTKHVKDLVPGNGPAVVDRVDGTTHFLGTAMSPDHAIQDYENRWRMQTNSKRNAFANYKSDPPEDKKLISVKEIRKHIIPGKTTRQEVDTYLDRLAQDGYWVESLPNPHAGQIQFKVKEGYWVDIEAGFDPQSKVTEITGGDEGTQP